MSSMNYLKLCPTLTSQLTGKKHLYPLIIQLIVEQALLHHNYCKYYCILVEQLHQQFNNLSILPNAEMAQKEYVDKYKLTTFLDWVYKNGGYRLYDSRTVSSTYFDKSSKFLRSTSRVFKFLLLIPISLLCNFNALSSSSFV